MREMASFAGWNFIGVTSGVLRDHGGNILVNIFSGPAVNAARGVAVQLNGAVQGFVSNFMTAVNPQITKSYACGDREYMFALMRRSSRMSFYLLLVLALPVIFNAEYILGLWLKDVPGHSAMFVRLFLVFALSESLSSPLITGMLATGRIRNYQIVVGGLQLLNLPVSYIFLKAGCMPEVTVIVAIVLSQVRASGDAWRHDGISGRHIYKECVAECDTCGIFRLRDSGFAAWASWRGILGLCAECRRMFLMCVCLCALCRLQWR